MVYGYRAARKMNLRAFILRLREDRIYCGGDHIIVLDSLIFQSCHFCSRFFWVAILKSEGSFSSVNRWSGKWFGSSIDVLYEAFKIAHILRFLTKNFYRFETVFFALWFWDFPRILYAYYAEWKFCHKYTHALSPVWNRPPYTRIICEKNFAPRYIWELAVRSESVGDWLGVDIFAFVYIMFLYMWSSFG